ncbi:glycoside hydrolase family 172 protein [Kaistia granuli]|uniref:glycoside hydrolase family 172 protein n=1 Tax=Kaistia granuli TaxID=363259 RepID=UPI00035D58CF|nr:glycoside hydrolase family 172 protein [Kaistia granuli]
MHLGNLSLLSKAKTRSISPENFTGEKGKGGMALEGTGASCARGLGKDGSGLGWKVSPSIRMEAGETRVIADIEGPGAIQQIWLTPANVRWRDLILRIYWDGQEHPSVESPLGDFFCAGWNQYAQVSSLAVCVNPGRAFNCYWEMPFRKHCRITLENRDPTDHAIVYYQINYTLTEVPADAAYFHAQFRRTNPLPFKEDYVILDGVKGQGHYVGTYMAWGVNNAGWWGEGEIKFFMDGDKEYPTICGTGTEDYFCGAYNFDGGVVDPTMTSEYREFTTAYAGLPQVIRPDGTYRSQTRFGMYRWHIMDPIRFESDLKVTIQALGWRTEKKDRRYLPLQDDIASVAFWYQTIPASPFPPLPDRDYLEII